MDPSPVTVRRRPSVKDVATMAGVSAQTVSRVNNNRSNVDPATRERVLGAMEALGYRRNSAGRSLVTGKFGGIGVIVSTLSSYGTHRTLEAIADAIHTRGYTLNLLPLQLPSSGEVVGALDQLVGQNVDGLILMVETSVLEQVTTRLPRGIPMIVMDAGPSHQELSIDIDNTVGIAAAMAQLRSLGHTSVTHVAGPLASYGARLRRDAWEECCLDLGLTPAELLYGDWTAESGLTIGGYLTQRPEVTAILAGNDQMALGIIRAYHDRGLSVPEHVSVIGFDDMEESAYFTPRLSTISQDFVESGRRAVDALLKGIDTAARVVTGPPIPSHFIARESIGPARQA